MASERAMVEGFCGSISELPVLTAVEMGEQPVLALRRISLPCFHQAKLDQLIESLLDLDDQRTAGHGADYVIRQAPAELLGDSKPTVFDPSAVIGSQVYVDEAQ